MCDKCNVDQKSDTDGKSAEKQGSYETGIFNDNEIDEKLIPVEEFVESRINRLKSMLEGLRILYNLIPNIVILDCYEDIKSMSVDLLDEVGELVETIEKKYNDAIQEQLEKMKALGFDFDPVRGPENHGEIYDGKNFLEHNN